MSEDKVAFSRRLKELISKSNRTQKQIADLCHITEAALSRYVSGERIPQAPILANLANVLRTTSDELLGRENPYSDFEKISVLVARSKDDFTEEQRRKLSEIILGVSERLEKQGGIDG